MRTSICVAAFVLLLIYPAMQAHSQKSGYRVVDNVNIGGEGGWDYLIADTSTERLFVSRGTHVQVFDLVKKSIVGDILNTNGVHGIALVPEFHKGFTSNGRDSSVTVFDLATLKIEKTVKIPARNPDAILYDPFTKRVFTFNGGSASTTAIDARTDSVVGTLLLDGRPEFGVSDGNGKIFVNIEDKSLIVEFDPKTLAVLARWSIAPGEEPSGLALDKAHHRLFSVCANKLMVVLDAQSGKVISTLAIGGGVDACAYDAARGLVFSSNGEGTLTVIRQESADKYSVVENIETQRGSRTMALDEKTHKIYLSAAKFGPPPSATPERPHPRPTIEPGSFSILVIDR